MMTEKKTEKQIIFQHLNLSVQYFFCAAVWSTTEAIKTKVKKEIACEHIITKNQKSNKTSESLQYAWSIHMATVNLWPLSTLHSYLYFKHDLRLYRKAHVRDTTTTHQQPHEFVKNSAGESAFFGSILSYVSATVTIFLILHCEIIKQTNDKQQQQQKSHTHKLTFLWFS